MDVHVAQSRASESQETHVIGRQAEKEASSVTTGGLRCWDKIHEAFSAGAMCYPLALGGSQSWLCHHYLWLWASDPNSHWESKGEG
jgi:hypothetical protein